MKYLALGMMLACGAAVAPTYGQNTLTFDDASGKWTMTKTLPKCPDGDICTLPKEPETTWLIRIRGPYSKAYCEELRVLIKEDFDASEKTICTK